MISVQYFFLSHEFFDVSPPPLRAPAPPPIYLSRCIRIVVNFCGIICGIFICHNANKFARNVLFFSRFENSSKCQALLYYIVCVLFRALSRHFISEVRIYLHNDFLRQRMPEIILCHFIARSFCASLFF